MAPNRLLNIAPTLNAKPMDLLPPRFPCSTVPNPPSPRKANELKLRSAGKSKSVKGISLLHIADRQIAAPGDTITFSTWIVNDSRERIDHVCLTPRSFTNAGMAQLSYTSQPQPHELSFGPLLPATTATFTFSYIATLDDQLHGGGIISAMLVRARTSTGLLLWDECDALVDMHASTHLRQIELPVQHPAAVEYPKADPEEDIGLIPRHGAYP